MDVFWWIILSSLMMSLIAWIGLITMFLKEKVLKKLLLPLVAFSAGSLLGGAFLHMIPQALKEMNYEFEVFIWILNGFILFFILEQFIHWRHSHFIVKTNKKPVTYLILIADGIHNFIGGLAIAGAFLVDLRIGLVTWLACAVHEIPQELGDFGILVHGGWKKTRALIYNFISAFTVVFGALFVYLLSFSFDTAFLLAFAAGNFIYISCSDLIPEIKHGDSFKKNVLHFIFFLLGITIIFSVRFITFLD